MYSDVVLGVDTIIEDILEYHKEERAYSLDTDLTAEDWKDVVRSFKDKASEKSGKPFPQDPREQLWGAIGAVFGSWMNPRAITYRALNDIPAEWGTAVNVQSMVFGNMGDDCATGVCFSRNPSTGDNHFYGEYLINAQGEDVVAGIRTPRPLTVLERREQGLDLPSMEEAMPDTFEELDGYRAKLEGHYRDMQDMEFTIQKGKLWMLQTRSGKRTVKAALKCAVDMCGEGLITREEAVARIDPASLDRLLHPTLDPDAPRDILGRGLPASPGAASGKIVFSAAAAEAGVGNGDRVVLARTETSPEDIGGMHVAEGILTTRGGMTSHAAVVARGMGRPCVSGAGDLKIDHEARTLSARGEAIHEGEVITIDGSSGEVYRGEVSTIQPELSGDFTTLMAWADEIRSLKVRANAETPEDARTAGISAPRASYVGPSICSTGPNCSHAPMICPKARAPDVSICFPITPRFPGPVQDYGRVAGYHSIVGPPIARVPAAEGRRNRRRGQIGGRGFGNRAPSGDRPARTQSHARPSGLPFGNYLSGNLRDAGPGDFRGRRGHGGDRPRRCSGDHDSIGRRSDRIGDIERIDRLDRRGRQGGNGRGLRLSRGHDDRAAARGLLAGGSPKCRVF